MSVLDAPSFSYPWALRVQAFALGALVYLVFAPASDALPRIAMPRWLAFIGLVTGILICTIAPANLPQPFVLPTIALGASICLLSSLRGDAFSGLAPASPLVWIGERSYSIYLCHLPLILIIREIMLRTTGLEPTVENVMLAVVGSAVLIGVASNLSYCRIELPFQRLGTRGPAQLPQVRGAQ